MDQAASKANGPPRNDKVVCGYAVGKKRRHPGAGTHNRRESRSGFGGNILRSVELKDAGASRKCSIGRKIYQPPYAKRIG